MPGWYERYKDVEGLRIVGLIQEQHAERCRLFMAWKQMDFPILVDSLNRTGIHAVPLMWAIDEHGVVQKTRPDEKWIEGEFLDTSYPVPETEPEIEEPSIGVMAFLEGNWNEAVEAFREEVEAEPRRGAVWFRLGCALRARHDSPERQAADFQEAISCWTEALQLRPENYIFNRRLQQYGPRLMKPYPFYDWVDQAQAEIAARGDAVPALQVALEGSERAQPLRPAKPANVSYGMPGLPPDPEGRLPRDTDGLVALQTVVAPSPIGAGQTARVYLRFTPDPDQEVTWDNEAGVLSVWIEGDRDFSLEWVLHGAAPLGDQPSTSEERTIELEVPVPQWLRGEAELSGYATYYVCSGAEGACVFMRQDFTIPFEVSEAQSRRRRR